MNNKRRGYYSSNEARERASQVRWILKCTNGSNGRKGCEWMVQKSKDSWRCVWGIHRCDLHGFGFWRCETFHFEYLRKLQLGTCVQSWLMIITRISQNCKTHGHPLPDYRVISHDNGIFYVDVYVNNVILGRGFAKNKKQAEQNAAKYFFYHISNDTSAYIIYYRVFFRKPCSHTVLKTVASGRMWKIGCSIGRYVSYIKT